MLTLEQNIQATRGPARAMAAGVPRITPIHDPVDKRHSDLAFSIDTGGRPSYRVLIARDRALFAAAQAGARNASNFYDSQRDGLLHDDGPPCFFLVPRSVLHAMLPAPRLYYTVIAYEDSNGARAVYGHPPETLATEAPSVALASDLAGSLSLMFGTPVERLRRVGASLALADEETGEDHGTAPPEAVGLSADDEADVDEFEAAAAYEGEDDEAGYEAAAALDDADGEADDPELAQSYADGTDWREPVLEGSEAAAAFEEAAPEAGVDDIWGGAAGAADAAGDAGYDDGFGDGFGDGEPAAQAYQEQGEDLNAGAAEPGRSDGDEAGQAFDAPAREPLPEPLPEMLPDEEADGAQPAQAGQSDDEVEVESAEGLAYDDSYGVDYADEQGQAPAAPPAARVPFDIEACKAILARIAPYESGSEGFARTLEDAEFAGRFGSGHPAHQRYHLGLTFGAFPFVQEQGTLGQLLVLMRERDRATFDATFPGADELIAVTNAATGPRAWESPDGLSARLRPVAGKLLWQEPWLARFKRAAAHPPFQGAQNEMAARLFVQPVLPVAQQIGLDSEQGLTLLVDRAVQMGATAALALVLDAATPVETPALRQQALASLGHADLAAFQRAVKLPVTGTWDVPTHAALIAALRASPRSPTPVLGCNEIVAAMLRHAQGMPWAERMARLRDASSAARLFQL